MILITQYPIWNLWLSRYQPTCGFGWFVGNFWRLPTCNKLQVWYTLLIKEFFNWWNGWIFWGSICWHLWRLLHFRIVVECINLAAPLLSKKAKIIISEPTFVFFVKVLEYFVNYTDLKVDSKIIEALLELTETNRVIVILVKVPISCTHSLESLFQLDPK